MKETIIQLLTQAVNSLQTQGLIPKDLSPPIIIEHTRDKQYGDLACNIALTLAKAVGRKPRELAELVVQHLPESNSVTKVEIAGPGFINFYLDPSVRFDVIKDIFTAGKKFGQSIRGAARRIHIEFVSSNPTGPLHVGHGRGAAFGAAVADLLEEIGCTVHREYYVNDAGRQMDILATSIWLRYLALCGESFAFPSNGYKGDYILDIANQIKLNYGDTLRYETKEVFKNVPEDTIETADEHIDALIGNANSLLGTEKYQLIFNAGLQTILADIREDLAEFGVTYQNWFSERSLKDEGSVTRAIEKLQAAGHVYEQEGALWFCATAFGDEKDRVVVRKNGNITYFAADIAYHMNKYERGFTDIIDVVGSDHHGYIPRVIAAMKAFNYPTDKLIALLVQFATLYRGKERVPMSTRGGQFVTLRELREEVGKDAARYFYVSRKAEQHMDFDLELAKSQSQDNPVYYIQYAHARISSVLRQLAEKNLKWDQQAGLAALNQLHTHHEEAILTALNRYAETVEIAALQYEPHILAHYLRDLAQQFHTYYNAEQFLVEDEVLRNARLCLIVATQQVFANGLKLLGVSAPHTM